MPISNSAFVRGTLVLLVAGLLALVAIVATNLFLVERSQVYFDDTQQARRGRAAAVDVRNALQDIETSQRGFLLTRDEAYLAPYNAALPQLDPAYERLADVLRRFPQADQPMANLRSAIDGKVEETAHTIDLARSGASAEAIDIVRTDAGKVLMDEARATLRAIITAADSQQEQGATDQSGNLNTLRLVTLGGSLIILFVAGGSALLAFRYTRELAQAREEMHVLNAGLEERVRERTQDLERANEEIQKFAYIVTHDLRAPLVNVMGFTAELEDSVGDLKAYMDGLAGEEDDPDDQVLAAARRAAAEDLPEAIGFIRTSTQKMDGLINAILKISREGRRPLKIEPVDLAALLGAAADTVHHQVSETGGAVEVEGNVPALLSDRLSLEQVFGNLLDNAVKYRAPDRPLQVTISARPDGPRIVVDVSDNGRGIAAQDHERVFELFRRSGSQTQPGEGIGLAHVRTLLRSLGGDITLSSELGRGTTFKVSLPRDSRAFVGSSAS